MSDRRAFRLAYDGRPFHGFQRQPDVPTVEDRLFDALRTLDWLDADADKPTGYAAAGRTDAGVSAVAQTVAFDAPAWLTPTALNSALPDSIRSWAVADVPADFHATHDATRRAYTYHCYAPDADLDRVRTAVDRLTGEHDFHNLTSETAGTVRDVTAAVDPDGDFLVLTVEAGGFPRSFVRRFVSLVRSIGVGATPMERIDQVLSDTPLSGPQGIPSAPAYPLVLTAVDYPGITFRPDDDARDDVRDRFAERQLEHRTRDRVFTTILDRI
ncbi:MAG: tRNA pseudouridine(38-40) synthase TruA [Halobacteriales archaeon]|nr:tRNA pseudouridine(38-40) synthase TruA [Halobacteriales archaeon]